MLSNFFKISRSKSEIYPLIGAVTFAVGMGTYCSVKNLFFNPDIKLDPKKRSKFTKMDDDVE